ncbi:XRE family transcriptional regulator [Saccharomonospora azurea]|uniref:helix-turn-helix domain-containing protein n=1 Tax=Saccharomonospora azurea TaxID=40988 RepID=UPI0033218DB8
MIEFGDVLVTARRARGLTQAQLADAAQLPRVTLSRYENDLAQPDDDAVTRLADALGLAPRFLRAAGSVRGGVAVEAHMRRQNTAGPTVWRQIEARLNLYRLHARMLYEEISVRAEHTVPRLDPVEVTPELAAQMVRMQWRMPLGPVRKLTRWIEAAGCLIVEEDFGTSRVDGMSQWIDDYPIILLNERMPTDRKRLTLAHELGHLALHSVEVSDPRTMEAEATAFAAELLLPADVIRPQLRTVTLGRLHDLKREWAVSMQALVERAHQLNTIKATQRADLYKSLSAKGWRTREPVSDELPPEYPELAADIGAALLAKGHTREEIAVLAGFAPSNANHLFNPARPRLRVV